jgi:hypothetical protein
MANILEAGRRRRFVHGVIAAAITVATAVALVVLSAGPGWFVLVFLLGAAAAMALLQARDST